MYEKEKIVRDERTREAAVKCLMGLDGKLGCILRHLGKPIMSSYDSSKDIMSLESNESEDFYSYLTEDEEKEDEVDLPEGCEAEEIGRHFDGLSRSMHLEIKYIFETHELSVLWKGYRVYQEVKGGLEAYVPSPDWEQCIEKLYKLAKKLDHEDRKLANAEMKERVKKEKLDFLTVLKRLWGV